MDNTLAAQANRIAELEAERDQLRDSWLCFHCGERFTDQSEALEHFGPTENYETLCIDADAREGRKLTIQLESTRNERDNLQDKCDGLSAHLDELQRYFGKDCTSVWLAGDRYSNVKFERDQLQAQVAAFRELLDVYGSEKCLCYFAIKNFDGIHHDRRCPKAQTQPTKDQKRS